MLSLVVPFFNEAEAIQDTYKELTNFLRHSERAYELIFVDDGSTDDSLAILRDTCIGDIKTRIISYPQNQGRGWAVTLGFRKAKGDVVGYIDSDLEIKARYIGDCVDLLKNVDVVVVSKHHSQSQVHTTWLRYLSSRLFNTWVRLVLKSQVNDHQAGLKLFKKKVVDSVLPKVTAKGWLFDVEFLYLAQKQHYTIGEVPIDVTYGMSSTARSLIRDFFKAYFFVVKLRLRKYA